MPKCRCLPTRIVCHMRVLPPRRNLVIADAHVRCGRSLATTVTRETPDGTLAIAIAGNVRAYPRTALATDWDSTRATVWVPAMNRAETPRLGVDGAPTKYSPGTEDSPTRLTTG